MGSDLVSACVFCGSMLFGYDLAPRMGLSADIGFSYSTLARRFEATETRDDGSDVTPKFLLVGLGQAWPAEEGLGAGTPASEWRARIAFGPSHDEQERKEEGDLERVTAIGTGRYENFLTVARFALGRRNSLEVAGERRASKSTDLINIGGENQEFSEQRSLSAERLDVALGLRHRWKDWEAAAAMLWSKNTGFNATANSFQRGEGALLGWRAEARWHHGCWTALARGQRVAGDFDVHRESFPAFEDRDSREPGSLENYGLGLGYAWPRFEVLFTASYDREHLPFVSLAVLGTETIAFDGGFDPDSLMKEYFYELNMRYTLNPAIRIEVALRFGYGSETVALTDSAGVLPPRTLEVARRGIFGGSFSDKIGSPEPTLYIGANFAIGTPR